MMSVVSTLSPYDKMICGMQFNIPPPPGVTGVTVTGYGDGALNNRRQEFSMAVAEQRQDKRTVAAPPPSPVRAYGGRRLHVDAITVNCRVEKGRGGLGHAATLCFPCPLIKPDAPISERPAFPADFAAGPRRRLEGVGRVASRRGLRRFRSGKTGAFPSRRLMPFGGKAPDAAISPDRGWNIAAGKGYSGASSEARVETARVRRDWR